MGLPLRKVVVYVEVKALSLALPVGNNPSPTSAKSNPTLEYISERQPSPPWASFWGWVRLFTIHPFHVSLLT